MASVNKVILVGNLGRDPETRYMPNGEAVTNVTIATTDSWKDKQTGEKREATEWHRVVFYRRLAEIAGQYLKKGSQVYIEGSLKTRKWQDKDGVEKYTTEVIADSLQMLGSRQGTGEAEHGGSPSASRSRDSGDSSRPAGGASSGGGGYSGTQSGGGARPYGGGHNDMADDIPFTDMSLAFDPVLKRIGRRLGHRVGVFC